MSTRHFVVPVRDLEDGPKTVRYELDDAFLRGVFENTDAEWTAPGSLELELTHTGRQILVRGQAALDVTLPCSRTLVPVPVALRPEIFLMLSQRSGTPGGAKAKSQKARRGKRGEPAKSKADKKGYQPWVDDPELADEATADDTYEGEEVVLDGFVREFLLLDLPMVPVASHLPADPNAAIPRPPAESGEKPVDPRLAPLAAIAARLRKDD